MTKAVLMGALERLGQRAEEEGLRLEICLFGGALMMLAYDARAATKDVDGVIHPQEEGLRLAEEVGREQGLPDQWLNDQVKIFTAPSGPTRELPWEGPGIMLTAPTAGYLLAMKALACRNPLPGYEGDIGDLRFLIRKMGVRSVQEIQEHIDAYYPDDVIRPEHEAVLNLLLEEEKNR